MIVIYWCSRWNILGFGTREEWFILSFLPWVYYITHRSLSGITFGAGFHLLAVFQYKSNSCCTYFAGRHL